jgi:hypothetical protein
MRVLKMNKGGSVDRQGYKLGGLWKEIKDLQGRRDRGSEDVVAFQTPVIVTTEPPRVRMDEGGEAEDPNMYRRDGSKKSTVGWLGPMKNEVTGGTMTEFSTDLGDGSEREIPTMVKGQSEEALAHMRKMPEGQGFNMKIPIEREIVGVARRVANERLDAGESQWANGEETRESYSAAGAVVKAGMKLFSKTKAPVPTKAPVVEKTKDIAMPEELNPKVSNAEYDEKTVDMSDKSDATLKPYKKVERYATEKEMYNALDTSKREKINIPIEEGSEVGIRLDIPAYQKGEDSAWVPTIHDEKGTGLTSHRATVALRNVNLKPSKGNEEQAYRIKMKDYHISQIDELVLEGRLRDKYRTGNLEAGNLIDATTKEGKDKIKKIKGL